jgi:membrane protein YqaA with SNARE-associated domain
MWWHYILVFLGALLVDIVPFPFPPAFTVMVLLQILFDLDVWMVIVVGVAGSVLGRYILLLYAPMISNRFLKAAKNEDIQFLGEKMSENKWLGQLVVLAYSLLPLPTTPLFLGAGISKIKPIYIIPAFLIGKLTSDSIALHVGKYASENFQKIVDQTFSWQSFVSLFLSLTLLFFLLFIDWRTLIQKKKFLLNFQIWK